MPDPPPWIAAADAGGALHAPATARNREPILEVLRRYLPPRGLVLEIASGSGEHAVHFAGALPQLEWQPTDPDEASLVSIAAHRAAAMLNNLRAPLRLDVTEAEWPVARADAFVAINMIQVAPRAAADALLQGAQRLLPAGGVLYIYGPFLDGAQSAASNLAFDANLRARNPGWGLREWSDVVTMAETRRLSLIDRVAMPADNFSLVFRRDAGD